MVYFFVTLEKFAKFEPYRGFLVDFTIDFPHPAFKEENSRVEIDFFKDSYVNNISRARTFGFMQEVEYLRSNGLAQGGSLDNAIVLDEYKILNDEGLIQGKVGSVLNKEEAKHAARQVGLTMLSSIVTHAPPNLKIKRVIKVLGMVNATPEFGDHPYVINGFSELMEAVFGTENGIGVRSAVGMSLPQNIAVEIEALFLLTS